MKSYTTAYVNFKNLDTSSQSKWYESLTMSISQQLEQNSIYSQFSNRSDSAGWLYQLRMWGNALTQLGKRLAIAIDDIEAILPREWSDTFFMTLRIAFNERDRELERITFLLAGSFEPFDLIQDQAISPFNISYTVILSDFSIQQVNQLVSFLELPDYELNEIAERIYYWTNGQPYLTQLICEYLSLETDLKSTIVDALIQKLLQEDKIHLPRIKRFLEQHLQLRPYLERIAAKIEIPYNPLVDTRQKELSLLGIIKSDEAGLCIIRNHIYEKAFKNLLIASSSEHAYLVTTLSTRLSEEALVGLSIAYGVNFKALPGIDKEAKIQSLVQSFEERGLLTTLSQYIQSLQLEDHA